MSATLGLYVKTSGRPTRTVNWLENAALRDINRICQLLAPGAALDRSEVLVKWQRESATMKVQNPDGSSSIVSPTFWAGTREFLLSPYRGSGLPGPVGTTIDGPTGILTNPESVLAFLNRLKTTGQSSDRLALMMYGHADGPGSVLFMQLDALGGYLPSTLTQAPSMLSASTAGSEPLDWLTLQSLSRSLQNSRAAPGGERILDIVCFEACQNATLELATVLAPHAEILVANQSSTPIGAWRFDDWPTALDTGRFPTHVTAAKEIVAAYSRLQLDDYVISAIDLGRIQSVNLALRTVADLLLAKPDLLLPALNRAAKNVPVLPESNADKRDLIKLVQALLAEVKALGLPGATLASACDELAARAAAAVLSKSTCKVSSKYGYNGLSIFLPDGTRRLSAYALTAYGGNAPDFADFKATTHWREVVMAFLARQSASTGS